MSNLVTKLREQCKNVYYRSRDEAASETSSLVARNVTT